MDALFYLASLIGVVWLVIWTIQMEGGKKPRWSPFDIKEPNQPVADKRYKRQKRG